MFAGGWNSAFGENKQAKDIQREELRARQQVNKKDYYTTYNNNKAIIKANKAVASEKANPKIEYENN